MFDDTLDDDVEDRDCPFVVHGLTGDSLTTKSASVLNSALRSSPQDHLGPNTGPDLVLPILLEKDWKRPVFQDQLEPIPD